MVSGAKGLSKMPEETTSIHLGDYVIWVRLVDASLIDANVFPVKWQSVVDQHVRDATSGSFRLRRQMGRRTSLARITLCIRFDAESRLMVLVNSAR